MRRGEGSCCAARKELERIVEQCLTDFGLYETDNSGGTILAISRDPFAVVKCCLAVQAAVRQAAPSFYGDETALSVPAVSIGVATGLCSVEMVKEGYYHVAKFRGRCVMEAEQIATDVSGGRIAASESTWYALAEEEGDQVRLKYVRYTLGTVRHCLMNGILSDSLTWDLYAITNVGATGADEEFDESTIVVLNPYRVLKTLFWKVPAAERADLLEAAVRASGASYPSVSTSTSDEEYCKRLFHILCGDVFSVENEEATVEENEENSFGSKDALFKK
eukprot:gene1108-biopygen906